jgi:malonyl-CoA O-methyltransferase
VSILSSLASAIRSTGPGLYGGRKTPLEKAIQWVKAHRVPGSGIPVHHQTRAVTQEVTGYFIPTLYKLGEEQLAMDLARWEASVQRADGGFAAPDGTPYTFDTAQVVRGFLAVLDRLPELEGNLRRACDFVEGQIDSAGRVLSPSYRMWQVPGGGAFSEYTNLYVLPPLLEAGRVLSETRYVAAAERALRRFVGMPDLVEFKPNFGTMSHVFGYMMEALVELGELNLARSGLQQVAAIQKEDGAIPAHPGVEWKCSTGMAQLGIAWYKLGDLDPAGRALTYLETIQNPSGGFYGSYGANARYFPREEISWAVKFFLDCCFLRSQATQRAMSAAHQ